MRFPWPLGRPGWAGRRGSGADDGAVPAVYPAVRQPIANGADVRRGVLASPVRACAAIRLVPQLLVDHVDERLTGCVAAQVLSEDIDPALAHGPTGRGI